MKILYYSAAPWINTGYGRCTREMVPRLQKEGYDIEIQCLDSVRGSTLTWHGEEAPVELEEPITVHPASTRFGLGDIQDAFEKSDADLLFTHFDTWMDPANSIIPDLEIPYVSYVIVDHYPAPNKVVKQVQNAHGVAAMSKYAVAALEQKGIRSKYVPHGVDTSEYYPIEKSSDDYPNKVITSSGEKDLNNTFLFGMVAANYGNRKHIPGHMEAFKKFIKEVDDEALLYLHTDQNAENGYNLYEVAQELSIPDKNIIWPNPDDYQNVGDGYLNKWYNAFDVFMNCSFGESWGLTITEAQATGTPCIVNNFSSMPEQLGHDPSDDDIDAKYRIGDSYGCRGGFTKLPHGLAVEPSVGMFKEKVSAKQFICHPRDIFRAMKYYYENRDQMEKDGEAAREHVVNSYEWDNHVIPELVNLFDMVGV